MSIWIDANKLIEFINSKFVVSWKHDYDGGFKDACVEILNAIEDTPSIEIIRCQDCKYWVYNFNGCSRNPCTEPWYAEDFCSYGERKEQ